MRQYIIGLSGASGSVYGLRLIQAAVLEPVSLHVIISDGARAVLAHEHHADQNAESVIMAWAENRHPDAVIHFYGQSDIAAGPASGSFVSSGMVVAPCAMSTLSAVASGSAGNLLHRSCDVTLKERRPLILMVRETPFNLIHIRNMETACLAGATIMPAMPSFYGSTTSVMDLVDSVVARALDHLSISHQLASRWAGPCCPES